MFSSEKQLVEKLVLDLQERYNTQYIVRELRGGNNIADIVYTTDIDRDCIVFDEYFNYPDWENGEFKAFQEFISESGLKYNYISYNRNHQQCAVKIIE